MACKALLIFFILALSIKTGLGAEVPKNVYVMTSSMGDKIIPYVVGKALGFYQQEGFDVDIVLTRGSIAIQGLMGGSGDYVNHTSIFPAILRGVPLKLLLVETDKPTFFFVSSSNITNFRDLAGKTIAIDDFAGNAGLIAREVLSRSGVAVNAVKFRVLGPPPYRLQALLGDLVDGTLLNYVMSRQAQAKGYRILGYTGDFVSEVGPSLAASTTKIKGSPEEVYRLVKATLKGLLFMYHNPEETLKFFMDVQGVRDLSLARDALEARLKRSSETAKLGIATEEALTTTIEHVQKQLQLGSAALGGKTKTADQVADFSFAKRAYEELKAEAWDAKKYRYKKQ